MIKFLPIPIVIINDKLEVVEASRPAYTIFNARYMPEAEQDNIKQLSTIILGIKEIISLIGAATIRLRKPGASERFRWENRDRSFEVIVSVLSEQDGEERYSVVFEEKTDQIAIQHSSARVRSYLESIMSSLQLGIIVTDRKLSVTNMNKAQEGFLKNIGAGTSMLQAVGMPLSELFEDEAEILEQVGLDVLDSGTVYAGIVEKYGTPPDETVFAVSFSPLRDENGKIKGLIRVSEDITEKQRLEANLNKAEVEAREVEAIRKVIITFKHEVNNSLMTIIGNVEVLQRTGSELPDDKKECLQNILEWADRIAVVTKSLEYMEQLKTIEYIKDGPEMIDL